MLFPLELDNLEATREGLAATAQPSPIVDYISVEIKNKMIQGPDDNDSLRIRIYTPKEKVGHLPALIWIQGGGYVLGASEGDDLLCQRFVNEANCIVVSVDYHLHLNTLILRP